LRLGIASDPHYHLSFEPEARTFVDKIQTIAGFRPDAVVLAGYPRAAALLLQEWSLFGPPVRWYFGAPLKDQGLVLNAPISQLAQATGVAPVAGATDDFFEQAFRTRWRDVAPSAEARFYFDAAWLLALALNAAPLDESGRFEATAVAQALHDVGQYIAGAKVLSWQDPAALLAAAAAHEEFSFQGGSGVVVLDDAGDRIGGEGTYWRISGDVIVSELGATP
jgi:ABC-type branched-subunit amino acid transport system substrate-binding protein